MTLVFSRNSSGYHTFRIPTIVKADTALLAFAEGRRDHAGDAGNIDLTLRRSFDGGHTWGPLQVVLEHGSDTAGNPCPVVDPATGDIVLLTTRNGGKVTENEIKQGRAPALDARRIFVQRSADQGASWTDAVEITDDVKLPHWRWYATGPVHGIALRHGRFAGRLVAPANHSAEDTGYGAHALLSDDGGHRWRIGAINSGTPGKLQPNESTVAELPDGTIAFNTRNQLAGTSSTRAFAYSSDGGESFDEPYAPLPDVVAPIIQGSLLAVGSGLLLSAPGHPTARAEMTVRKSADGGHTWRVDSVLSQAPAGYSDLVDLGSGKVGLLYETGFEGPYEQIRFALL